MQVAEQNLNTQTAVKHVKRARGLSRGERARLVTGLAFVSPWLLGISVFLLYPIVSSLYYSLCDYSVLQPPRYIGLENYRDLLADDVFGLAVKNTFFYASWALPLGVILSLSISMLLNTGVRGMAIYRTIFFLPSLVPTVASAVLWLWIFNGKYGILNFVLGAVGIKGPGW